MNPRTPMPSQLFLADKVISYLQIELGKLSWLDLTFGRVQKLVKDVNGISIYYPAYYMDSGEYKSMLPDQGLGNFAFFIIDDPQGVAWNKNGKSIISCPFSLVVWYDLSKINGEPSLRNTETVKQILLNAIHRTLIPDEGSSVSIENIYEKAENIYKGFTNAVGMAKGQASSEVSSQFMMQPFNAIRFEGTLKYRESCQTL